MASTADNRTANMHVDAAGTAPARRLVIRRLTELAGGAGGNTPPPVRIPAQAARDAEAISAAGSPPASRPIDPAPTEIDPAAANRLRVQAHLTLRLVLEVLTEQRPAAQLAGLLTERARQYVLARIGRLDEARPRGRRHVGAGRAGHRRMAQVSRSGGGLRSLRVCFPADDAAEVTVVWRHRGHSRALAARFEPQPGGPGDRWLCTDLRLG